MITVEKLLSAAVDKNASDIHLIADLPPKIRVNGALVNMDYPILKSEDIEKISICIMNEEQNSIFRKSGEVQFTLQIPNVARFRTSIFRQKGIISCSMRIINEKIPSWTELGIPEKVMELLKIKRGIVLVAGVAGSGKTTTAACMVDKISREHSLHIITMEKSIEYIYSGSESIINQRQIGEDADSYTKAVETALKADADIIFIDELKDEETIAAALTASEAGCIVVSTVNAAEDVIKNLIYRCSQEYRESIYKRLLNNVKKVVLQSFEVRQDETRAINYNVLADSEESIGNIKCKNM